MFIETIKFNEGLWFAGNKIRRCSKYVHPKVGPLYRLELQSPNHSRHPDAPWPWTKCPWTKAKYPPVSLQPSIHRWKRAWVLRSPEILRTPWALDMSDVSDMWDLWDELVQSTTYCTNIAQWRKNEKNSFQTKQFTSLWGDRCICGARCWVGGNDDIAAIGGMEAAIGGTPARANLGHDLNRISFRNLFRLCSYQTVLKIHENPGSRQIYTYRDIFVAVAVAVREVHAEDRQDTSEAAGRQRPTEWRSRDHFVSLCMCGVIS